MSIFNVHMISLFVGKKKSVEWAESGREHGSSFPPKLCGTADILISPEKSTLILPYPKSIQPEKFSQLLRKAIDNPVSENGD